MNSAIQTLDHDSATGTATLPDGIVTEPTRNNALRSVGLPATLGELPVELDVAVAVRGFRVRNLLALQRGTVVESQWSHSEDLPLAAGEQQIAWTEFEVVDDQLAVRLIRLY